MSRLWLLLALALAACTEGEPLAPAPAPAATPDITTQVLTRAVLYRPEGPGPFPAVVVLHGCGGVDQHHHDWAKRLVGWGYVALVLDSFGPRGHGSQCAGGDTTPASTRAGDAWSAAQHLASLPFVRADRIGVIGFSHGGRTVMATVQGAPPFAAAVAFYPACDQRTQSDVGIPTLILIGDKDDWTPANRCRDLLRALKRPSLVEMTVYPNAWHGFDRERPGVRWVQGSTGSHRMERDPEAAADAVARTRAFFAARLTP